MLEYVFDIYDGRFLDSSPVYYDPFGEPLLSAHSTYVAPNGILGEFEQFFWDGEQWNIETYNVGREFWYQEQYIGTMNEYQYKNINILYPLGVSFEKPLSHYKLDAKNLYLTNLYSDELNYKYIHDNIGIDFNILQQLSLYKSTNPTIISVIDGNDNVIELDFTGDIFDSLLLSIHQDLVIKTNIKNSVIEIINNSVDLVSLNNYMNTLGL